MSSLNIAVGFDSPGNQAKPFLVYLGRSGSEFQRAIEASSAARFELFRNVHGLRKNNSRAASNAQRTAATVGADARAKRAPKA